ncbi:hypothetical protein [Amycolatopsis sp. CA-128772]|uniref:hypothetical protein n=1 Tax=Amycolatopsis sp. CA-128772 TaxID=2073159 RepID=UPI0011B07783|nr:hypothetical protein [Amycolatopsis sp. CA-128772]
MSDYLDNPAGRLLALFEAARTVDQGKVASAEWAGIFRVEHLSPQFFRAIANMASMASETRARIAEVEPEDHVLHLEHFGQVDNVIANFARSLNVNMGGFLEPLDNRSGEYALKLCSAILHRKRSEGQLQRDERASLLDQVMALTDEVEKVSDLDRELRGWLLLRLHDIRRALQYPDQFGLVDISNAHDLIIGGLQTKRSRIAQLAKSKIAKNFVGVMVALDLAVNLGANSLQIAQSDGHDSPKSSTVVIEIQNQIEQHVVQLGESESVRQLPAGQVGDPDGAGAGSK